MTSARIQPFCTKYNTNIGCFDGTRINPRNITQRNTSLFIHNNHLRLKWKSIGISFSQALEELKNNFKVVDKVISDIHVKSFVQYEYKPEKIQSPLTHIVAYDLETFNKTRIVAYFVVVYIK